MRGRICSFESRTKLLLRRSRRGNFNRASCSRQLFLFAIDIIVSVEKRKKRLFTDKRMVPYDMGNWELSFIPPLHRHICKLSQFISRQSTYDSISCALGNSWQRVILPSIDHLCIDVHKPHLPLLFPGLALASEQRDGKAWKVQRRKRVASGFWPVSSFTFAACLPLRKNWCM